MVIPVFGGPTIDRALQWVDPIFVKIVRQQSARYRAACRGLLRRSPGRARSPPVFREGGRGSVGAAKAAPEYCGTAGGARQSAIAGFECDPHFASGGEPPDIGWRLGDDFATR